MNLNQPGRWVGILTILLWVGASSPVIGQSNAAVTEERSERSIFSLDSSRVTGDWAGYRTAWEESGVRVHLFLNDQFQTVIGGGSETNGHGKNSASIDALFAFDLQELQLVDHAEVLLHLQANWGGGINDRTGALYQVNDDSDGSIGGHVAQLWYRQHFPEQRMALTFGYLDYQTIVDRNALANSEDKQFMHQTLDTNPLVPLRIGIGVWLSYKPADWYSLTIGIADGQAIPYKGGISRAFHEEDWFTTYLEQGLHMSFASQSGDLKGNYRFGVFYDPGPRKTFSKHDKDQRTRAGDYGFYVSLDQALYRERETDDQGLGVFARFGYRSPENNKMSRFWSAGFSYKGLIPDRDDDVLGLGFSLLRSSHLYRDRVDDSVTNETIYEMYYAIQLSKWLVVTPDVQYVDNPGGDGSQSHATTAGVRVRVSF